MQKNENRLQSFLAYRTDNLRKITMEKAVTFSEPGRVNMKTTALLLKQIRLFRPKE